MDIDLMHLVILLVVQNQVVVVHQLNLVQEQVIPALLLLDVQPSLWNFVLI